KMAIGSAYPLAGENDAEIRGRDLATGLPKTIVVSAAEIRKALEEPVNAIVNAVKSTLDKTPPELASDLMDRGIVCSRVLMSVFVKKLECQFTSLNVHWMQLLKALENVSKSLRL
ncbi:MAG: hypothetical protein RL690_544, partial [Actinomycetota bacterium]